ncbi:Dabb family protein [Ruegeria arenilitoris]|uniref:Dabb family protein n=1 Tax=Ruegeria arenilitoris TaxID=1173585 RepID=UPI00147EBB6C|nr:Dabb family protein [Ruegeria arenilitoris]
MIRHIVLTKFKTDVTEETIENIYSGLSELSESLTGAGGFTGGRSNSPEQIERGYMHGFVIDFTDWSALERYQSDETHKALGAKLVQNTIGGIDGILVLDIEV